MIIKDERDVIGRCLDSVKTLIDYWVIVDTGSSDGTQSFIKSYMDDIPGELYERPWKGFGESRTEALELAKDKGDYLLFIDADDYLELEDGFQFSSLDKDVYSMRRGSEGFSYEYPQLAKASLPWRYVGVTHEYLTSGQKRTSETLRGVRYVSGDGGFRAKVPKEKFLKNIELLEEGLKNEPQNARYMFYLAESYRDAQKPEEAIKVYQKRIKMRGWEEEVYWSYFQIAKLQQLLECPIDTIISSYYKAHYYRPHRAEPVYYLAEIFNQQKNYAMAYAALMSRFVIPNPPKRDILFNLDWIEKYGLIFQRSICAYYVGRFQESLNLCDLLLGMEGVPENIKKQTQINRKFSADKFQSAAVTN